MTGMPPASSDSLAVVSMNALTRFYARSVHVLRFLNDLRVCPAIAIPKSIRRRRAEHAWWRIVNPDLRAIGIDPEINQHGPSAKLSDWFNTGLIAYKSAKSDKLRADLWSLIHIMPSPADDRHVSIFAREPGGLGLREFERMLAPIRRHLAVQSVKVNRKNPSPMPALGITLNATDRAITAAVLANKFTSDAIAVVVKKSPEHVRRIISKKLKPLGQIVGGDDGHGYRPGPSAKV